MRTNRIDDAHNSRGGHYLLLRTNRKRTVRGAHKTRDSCITTVFENDQKCLICTFLSKILCISNLWISFKNWSLCPMHFLGDFRTLWELYFSREKSLEGVELCSKSRSFMIFWGLRSMNLFLFITSETYKKSSILGLKGFSSRKTVNFQILTRNGQSL